ERDVGSRGFPIRSRAVSLPFACCFSTAFSEPWWIAASRSSSSWASFSSYVSGLFWRMRAPSLAEQDFRDVALAHRLGLAQHPDLALQLLVRAVVDLLGVGA